MRAPIAHAPMLHVMLIAAGLVAANVALHAAGMAWVLRTLVRRGAAPPPERAWPVTWLLDRFAWALVLIHAAEIAAWALFYRWQGCLPDAESAFYFSGVTYATIGYGDLVLPKPWRMLAPVQGLTGILMCGLSAGLFFAIVAEIHAPLKKPD